MTDQLLGSDKSACTQLCPSPSALNKESGKTLQKEKSPHE